MVNWDLIDAAGTTVDVGTSFGRYSSDGRLVQMTGFSDAQAYLKKR